MQGALTGAQAGEIGVWTRNSVLGALGAPGSGTRVLDIRLWDPQVQSKISG